jgi:hypothetical protein
LTPNSALMMRAKRPISGIVAIAGIALFGALVLVLLYRAPRFATRAPKLPFGLPRRALRVLEIDVRSIPSGLDAALVQISSLKPDLVLMQGAEGRDTRRVAAAIGAPDADRSVAFYPAQNVNGPASTWGNLICSKYPLYESRSIPNRGGSFGVWAVVVVDDMKFYAASAHFAEPGAPQQGDVRNEVETFTRAYRGIGSPPIVIGSRGAAVQDPELDLLRVSGLTPAGAGGTARVLTGGDWKISEMQSNAGGVVFLTVGRAGG